MIGAIAVGSALAVAAVNYYASQKMSDAQKKAADAAKKAHEKGIDTQLEMYYQSREDMAPWRETGENALADYYKTLTTGGGYQQSPGYAFRMNEGINALDRSALAGGRTQNKNLIRFAEDYASNDYNNYLNHLANLAGFGQTAVNNQAAINTTTGQSIAGGYGNIANNALLAGNARASGYANMANSVTAGLNNLAGLYAAYQMQQQPQGGVQGGSQYNNALAGYQMNTGAPIRNPYTGQIQGGM